MQHCPNVALMVPIAGTVNWVVLQHDAQRTRRGGEPLDLLSAVLVGAAASSLVTLPWLLPFAASALDIGLLAMLGVVQPAIHPACSRCASRGCCRRRRCRCSDCSR